MPSSLASRVPVPSSFSMSTPRVQSLSSSSSSSSELEESEVPEEVPEEVLEEEEEVCFLRDLWWEA